METGSQVCSSAKAIATSFAANSSRVVGFACAVQRSDLSDGVFSGPAKKSHRLDWLKVACGKADGEDVHRRGQLFLTPGAGGKNRRREGDLAVETERSIFISKASRNY